MTINSKTTLKKDHKVIYYSPSKAGIFVQNAGVVIGPLSPGELGVIIADNPELAWQASQALEYQELFGEPLPRTIEAQQTLEQWVWEHVQVDGDPVDGYHVNTLITIPATETVIDGDSTSFEIRDAQFETYDDERVICNLQWLIDRYDYEYSSDEYPVDPDGFWWVIQDRLQTDLDNMLEE